MNFLFDTSALLHFLKKTPQALRIEQTYYPFSKSNLSLISIVSQAEILSIAKQNNWGEK